MCEISLTGMGKKKSYDVTMEENCDEKETQNDDRSKKKVKCKKNKREIDELCATDVIETTSAKPEGSEDVTRKSKKKKKRANAVSNDEQRAEAVSDEEIIKKSKKKKRKSEKRDQEVDSGNLENTYADAKMKKSKKSTATLKQDVDVAHTELTNNTCNSINNSDMQIKKHKKKRKHATDEELYLDEIPVKKRKTKKLKKAKLAGGEQDQRSVEETCDNNKDTKKKSKKKKLVDNKDQELPEESFSNSLDIEKKSEEKMGKLASDQDFVEDLSDNSDCIDKKKKSKKKKKKQKEFVREHAEDDTKSNSITESNSKNGDIQDSCKSKKSKKRKHSEEDQEMSSKSKKKKQSLDSGLDGVSECKDETEHASNHGSKTNKKCKKSKDHKSTKKSSENKETNSACTDSTINGKDASSDKDTNMFISNHSQQPAVGVQLDRTDASLGQWASAEMGSSERQNKFAKLLGGFRKPKDPSMTNGAKLPDKKFNMAFNQTQQSNLYNALESQFELARGILHDSRGGGLGYEPPPGQGKKFHINTTKISSTKFED